MLRADRAVYATPKGEQGDLPQDSVTLPDEASLRWTSYER